MLMLLWGAATFAADGAEEMVAVKVNGPRGNVLLQDEMPLPVERVIPSPDGKHSLGVYITRMDNGHAVMELVAGKEKDGKPLAKVQQSFELSPFEPGQHDLKYKKSNWSVEGILGAVWDPPAVTEADADTTRYVLAWDDAKLLRNPPEIEPAAKDAPKPKPKPKPKKGAEDEVVVVRELEHRDDPAHQARPMTVVEPYGTRFVKVDSVPAPSSDKHCVVPAPMAAVAEGDAPATDAPKPALKDEPEPFYVEINNLVPRLTSREVTGKFTDGTGYRVAAGVPVTAESDADDNELYRVNVDGLSFVIQATEEDLAFYYRPTTHLPVEATRPMSLKAGTVGATQLGPVEWEGEGALPVQGLRGVAAPIATVRTPCAEVRLRPEADMLER
ncbi:MAG: hypothetical protein R3F59_20150 [Myxococcota bacterium]